MRDRRATIFSELEYPVTIRSLPTHLTVEVSRSDGYVVHKAMTPVTLTLTKKGQELEVLRRRRLHNQAHARR